MSVVRIDLRDLGGHAAQLLVALGVAPAVVVLLEVVEVEEEEAQGPLLALAAPHLLVEVVLEVAAVVEPGQGVGDGLVVQVAVGGLEVRVLQGQLVAGLLEQLRLLLDGRGHVVEALGQLGQLVASVDGQADVQLARAQPLGRRARGAGSGAASPPPPRSSGGRRRPGRARPP